MGTEHFEVCQRVVTPLASSDLVVDLQILQRPAPPTSPPDPLEHLLHEPLVVVRLVCYSPSSADWQNSCPCIPEARVSSTTGVARRATTVRALRSLAGTGRFANWALPGGVRAAAVFAASSPREHQQGCH